MKKFPIIILIILVCSLLIISGIVVMTTQLSGSGDYGYQKNYIEKPTDNYMFSWAGKFPSSKVTALTDTALMPIYQSDIGSNIKGNMIKFDLSPASKGKLGNSYIYPMKSFKKDINGNKQSQKLGFTYPSGVPRANMSSNVQNLY
jgi:hypothetical protein